MPGNLPVMPTHSDRSPILVLFDGHCGLCNGFVDFLLARDHARRLRFAPLQGETGSRYAAEAEGVDSVIVVHDGQRYLHSTGALVALSQLGGLWRAAAWLRAVPRGLRDVVYRFVARHRYAWFGKRAMCRVPSEAERPWFLP